LPDRNWSSCNFALYTCVYKARSLVHTAILLRHKLARTRRGRVRTEQKIVRTRQLERVISGPNCGLVHEWGFGLLAQWEHRCRYLVAKGAKWATKLVEGLCPPVLHGPGHPPPPPPPIRLLEPEELPGGVRPVPDQPLCSAAQATSAAAGPPSPVPGWVEMARAVLLRVCPSLHPLQTLLCAAFCALKLLSLGSSPLP
jgi:hypothetical protein